MSDDWVTQAVSESLDRYYGRLFPEGWPEDKPIRTEDIEAAKERLRAEEGSA